MLVIRVRSSRWPSATGCVQRRHVPDRPVVSVRVTEAPLAVSHPGEVMMVLHRRSGGGAGRERALDHLVRIIDKQLDADAGGADSLRAVLRGVLGVDLVHEEW